MSTGGKEVFVIERVITLHNGCSLVLTYQHFEDRDLATKASATVAKMVAALASNYMAQAVDHGSGVELESTGRTVMNFLNELGIKSVAHRIVTFPVQGAIVVPPTSPLIIPGGRTH